MFCLILFEVLDVLSHEARWLNWKFDLSLLSVLLIFVLPFYFFYLLLSNVDLGYKQAAVFAFAPTALYLWAFYTVTNSLPITGDLQLWKHHHPRMFQNLRLGAAQHPMLMHELTYGPRGS